MGTNWGFLVHPYPTNISTGLYCGPRSRLGAWTHSQGLQSARVEVGCVEA